jgi:hypothetical protein
MYMILYHRYIVSSIGKRQLPGVARASRWRGSVVTLAERRVYRAGRLY